MSLLALAALGTQSRGAEAPAAARFTDEIQPLLMDYCYGCHGDGMKKGKVAFDGFASEEALLSDRELWWSVLKNVRAGIMPPAGKPRPTGDEVRLLEDWIKRRVFGTDPADPDPGRVTLRRLNRVEYRNTIRDLMGIDFRTDEEFPADDTGYGFDNIGDVLTVSPLLLEKYMAAAETIVAAAVPTVSKVISTAEIPGPEFRGPGGPGSRMTFYDEARVAHAFHARTEGTYRLVVNLEVMGSFFFDAGRCQFAFNVDGRERFREEFGWENGKKHRFEFTETWKPGDHALAFDLKPLTPAEKKTSSVDMKTSSVDMKIASVVVEGPIGPEHRSRPKNFDRFFSGDAPDQAPDRRRYAREILAHFATRAFRRPCDDRTLDRLVAIAEEGYQEPGKTFEHGVAQAMVAVLASPRFLFRVEGSDPAGPERRHPLVDEYALASRLSYFLWSTMPDDELFRLAERGELRKDLPAQVKRLLDDPRSDMLVKNFTGQWLQARDVEGTSIDPRTVLARDRGEEKQIQRDRAEILAFFAKQEAIAKLPAKDRPATPPVRPRALTRTRVRFEGPLRLAMRRETEMFFAGIVREDRSVLDLLDSDYTYLNEPLATHYGIPGVTGESMRKVTLPKDSPRGGLLTQGTVLVVTSNPTRTSPVKRGLFILDNIMGTPPPPPPPDIGQLEESEAAFKDREPTLREVLELHRSQPLCYSCHNRMDPLGLALENFNAMGMWREKERNQPLDTAGKLITGESFAGIRDLKRILKDGHRGDFYRCLTEKLLTYALGRGLDASDVESVDRIVDRLDREQGRFSALLNGVIESAPFQKRRNGAVVAASAAGRSESDDQRTARP